MPKGKGKKSGLKLHANDKAKAVFIEHFRKTGIVTDSARRCGVTKVTVYRWKDVDPDFAAAFVEAKEEATESLLAEARSRAMFGQPRLKFHEGRMIMVPQYNDDGTPVLKDGVQVLVPYVEYDKSDALMCFLLKGLMPETFRERVENRLVGADGGPLRIVEEVIVERQGDQAAPGASSVPPE